MKHIALKPLAAALALAGVAQLPAQAQAAAPGAREELERV